MGCKNFLLQITEIKKFSKQLLLFYVTNFETITQDTVQSTQIFYKDFKNQNANISTDETIMT